MADRIRKPGRPTKFDADRAAEALRAAGSDSLEWVARGCKVGRRTLQSWLARGRAGEEPFAGWARAFDARASRVREARMRAYWTRYYARSRMRWRRFRDSREAWWLARLGPEEFRRRRLAWLERRGLWAAHARATARFAAGDRHG